MQGTSFQELQDIVYENLGSDSSDPALALIVPAAINYAQVVVALLFKPQELHIDTAESYTANSKSLDLSGLNFVNVTSVYNNTDSSELWFIPFNSWRVLVPQQMGATRFFSLFGNTLYIADVPTADKSLKIFYMSYPTELIDLGDKLDYVNYDSYIISVASGICFAAKEEGASADVCSAVAASLGAPLLQGAQMKEMIAGRQALLESTIAQSFQPQTGTAKE